MSALAYPAAHDRRTAPRSPRPRPGGSTPDRPIPSRPIPSRPISSRPISSRVAATHPSRSRHAARPIRPGTYARRRAAAALAFLALVALAAAAVLGFLGGGPLAAPEPSTGGAVRTVAARTYVVQPGDTLWSIARRAQPTGDVRRLVDELGRAHGSGPLQVGERLVVP